MQVKLRDNQSMAESDVRSEDLYRLPNYPTLDDYFPKDKKSKKKSPYERFRPPPGVEYELSETEAEMDAGITKMRLIQTRVEYAPGQEFEMIDETSSKSIQNQIYQYHGRLLKGRGPVWEFLEEKRARLQNAKQRDALNKCLAQFDSIKAAGKKYTKEMHALAMSKTGPAWYQELSNKQFRILDDLKNVLAKDHKFNTIVNTQDALIDYGLVLLPNHTKIEYALKKCWKCPVEFLLLLFKILDPHRKCYGCNDRLILSGVVHLTIKDTLKELHLRIPSPERPPAKKKPRQREIRDNQTYPSPYLEPLVLKFKERPEYIYKNRHKEYYWMKSYFDYRDEMYEWYEDPLPPVVQLAEDGKPIKISKYARPPRIPVRLITRIKPKPKMLRRLIKPQPYISECATAIDMKMDEKKKKETIHLNTDIDLTRLCACQGVQESKEFTLNIKISTTSERILLSQDIKPFDETTGNLKIVSVEKKPPCICNDPDKLSVEANIEQKFECICNKPEEQRDVEVCDCIQQTGFDPKVPRHIDPSEISYTSDLFDMKISASDMVTLESEECVCADTAKASAPPPSKVRCDWESNLSCNSYPPPPPKETCVCTGKAGKFRDPHPETCVCSSASSESTSIAISHSDQDPCECFGVKKERYNEDGCRCVKPEKEQPERERDVSCPCGDTTCTCMKGDGALRKMFCKCMEDENAVCKCTQKIDLTKICRCEVPNRVAFQNVPTKLCTCQNPNLTAIDKHWRCRCLGLALADSSDEIKPDCGCQTTEKEPNRDTRKFGEHTCACYVERLNRRKRYPCIENEHETAEKSCDCKTEDEPRKRGRSRSRSRDRGEPCDTHEDETCCMAHGGKRSKSKEKPCCLGAKLCLGITIEDEAEKKKKRPDCLKDLTKGETASEKSDLAKICDCMKQPPEKERNPYMRCECGKPPYPLFDTCACQHGDPHPDQVFCTCGGHKPPRLKQKRIPDAVSKRFTQGREDRIKDEWLEEKVLEHYQDVLDTDREYDNTHTGWKLAKKTVYQNFQEQNAKKDSVLELNEKRKPELKFLSEKKFFSDTGVDPFGSMTTGITNLEAEISQECVCDKVYNSFMLEHDKCIAMYDEYIYFMMKHMEAYLEELEPDSCGCMDEVKYPDKKKSDGLCQLAKEENRLDVCPLAPEDIPKPPTPPKEEEPPPEKVKCDCNVMLDFDGCICLLPEPDEPLWEYDPCECIHKNLLPCVCKAPGKPKKGTSRPGTATTGSRPGTATSSRPGKGEVKTDSTKAGLRPAKPQTKQKFGGKEDIEALETEEEDERIIRIEEFPKKWKGQLKLLKTALEMLREDNYPLAKLPDCHKLPHFRIWLNMRANNYISMEDREKLNEVSKNAWNHILLCHRETALPDLGLDMSEIRKMTWARVNTHRNLIAGCKSDYYRRLKQNYICEIREFFPSLFHHELYNPNFRDTIFSYLPSDENHLHVFKPWMMHEKKDISKRTSCLV